MEIKSKFNEKSESVYTITLNTNELFDLMNVINDFQWQIDNAEETNNGYWIRDHFITKVTSNDLKYFYENLMKFDKQN